VAELVDAQPSGGCVGTDNLTAADGQ